MEEKPSSLKCGATNAKIKTAFVEYSTHESIKKQCTHHQSKTHTHSTSSLFDWCVWFLNMVGFSIPRTFTLRSILPTPVILRGAEGEVAESMFQQITLTLRERGDRSIRWLSAGKSTFAKTLNRSDGNRTARRSFPSLFENVDSATPGKPCVQNDMRVR